MNTTRRNLLPLLAVPVLLPVLAAMPKERKTFYCERDITDKDGVLNYGDCRGNWSGKLLPHQIAILRQLEEMPVFVVVNRIRRG